MLNLRKFFVGFGLALCAFAFAACGNSGPTYTAPTPGPTCSPGETVQMVYPIPGATGVPDSPQQLVFAVASALPTYNAWLGTSSTTATLQTIATMKTITAAQVPSPAATPSNPNWIYQSVTLASGLSPAGTTWFVWVNDTSSNCTPIGPLGSFTIQ